MLYPISYESTIRAPLYETDSDGSLHIIIPPQNFGLFGVSPICWGTALGFPPIFTLVVLGLYPSEMFLAAVVSCAMAGMLLVFGWIDAYPFRFKTWIDATPSALIIRRQQGTSISNRHFSRDALQAIGVVRQGDDVLSWDLRVHGRYEWEITLSSARRSDLEEIANRLRTYLDLPEKPHSP